MCIYQKFKFYIIFIISLGCLFSLHSPSVLFFNNSYSWSDSDLYEEILKSDWDALDVKNKKEALHDFIKKELVFLAAEQEGITLNPSNQELLINKKNYLLINNTYEHLIARPLIESFVLDLNFKHLKSSSEAYHLLVGFNGSEQDTESLLSQEDALALADSLFLKIQTTAIDSGLIKAFSLFATKHSIDPSAKKNGGYLGWVPWGRTVMSFQRPLFESNQNVLLGPILTEYGYHLILKTGVRNSDFYFFNEKNYNDLIYKVGQNTLNFDSLRVASSGFDSLLIKNSNFNINPSFFSFVFQSLKEKNEKNKVRGDRGSLLLHLKEIGVSPGVLFVLNGRGYGLGWLIDKLERIPSTRVGKVDERDDLLKLIKNFVLQDLAVVLGFEKNIHLKSSFKRDLKNNNKNEIYNKYISFLMSSIPPPDSVLVLQEYEKSLLSERFLVPERAVFSEIRVFKEGVAQEVLTRFLGGALFEDLLVEFGGSIKEPITLGKNIPLSEKVFGLNIGDVSDIIYNKNGSFSIVRVEDFLQAEPFSLDRVYAQLERELVVVKQEKIKEGLFDRLVDDFLITINYSVVGL